MQSEMYVLEIWKEKAKWTGKKKATRHTRGYLSFTKLEVCINPYTPPNLHIVKNLIPCSIPKMNFSLPDFMFSILPSCQCFSLSLPWLATQLVTLSGCTICMGILLVSCTMWLILTAIIIIIPIQLLHIGIHECMLGTSTTREWTLQPHTKRCELKVISVQVSKCSSSSNFCTSKNNGSKCNNLIIS